MDAASLPTPAALPVMPPVAPVTIPVVPPVIPEALLEVPSAIPARLDRDRRNERPDEEIKN